MTDPRRGVMTLTITLTLTDPRGGNYLKTDTNPYSWPSAISFVNDNGMIALYCRLADGGGGREGECLTPCKTGRELSGRGNVRGKGHVWGNISRVKCSTLGFRYDSWNHLFELKVGHVPVVLDFRLAPVPDFHETQRCNNDATSQNKF